MSSAKLRSVSLAVIAVGAAASLGILVYALLSWDSVELRELPEAAKALLTLISPYFGLAMVALLLSRTTLASALVLLGSALTTLLGLVLLFRLLIRVDAEAFLYLLLAVSTQWTGVLVTAGAAGVCLLVQWLVAARGRRS